MQFSEAFKRLQKGEKITSPELRRRGFDYIYADICGNIFSVCSRTKHRSIVFPMNLPVDEDYELHQDSPIAYGDTYYFIRSKGEIASRTNYNSEFDKLNFRYNNFFRDIEDAKTAKKLMILNYNSHFQTYSKWKPRKGEKYYYIRINDQLETKINEDSEEDQFLLLTGNQYKNQEFAENALRRKQQIAKIILEVNVWI